MYVAVYINSKATKAMINTVHLQSRYQLGGETLGFEARKGLEQDEGR